MYGKCCLLSNGQWKSVNIVANPYTCLYNQDFIYWFHSVIKETTFSVHWSASRVRNINKQACFNQSQRKFITHKEISYKLIKNFSTKNISGMLKAKNYYLLQMWALIYFLNIRPTYKERLGQIFYSKFWRKIEHSDPNDGSCHKKIDYNFANYF